MVEKQESSAPQTPIEALDLQVWKTKGARFNASRRLMLNHHWSVGAIAALSVYSVVAGVLQLTKADSATGSTAVSVALIGASIGILTLSLLESARSYRLRADRLHRCGMQLNELYSEIRFESIQKSNGAVMALMRKYHDILRMYEDNHAPVDYNMFLAQNPSDFGLRWYQVTKAKLHWYWRSAGPYLVGIAAPPMLFLLLH